MFFYLKVGIREKLFQRIDEKSGAEQNNRHAAFPPILLDNKRPATLSLRISINLRHFFYGKCNGKRENANNVIVNVTCM